MKVKNGFLTSEFWLVVVAAVLSVAVAAGYVTVEESQAISNAVAETINAVANLVTALAPIVGVVSYVWSRTKLKVG